MAKANPKSLSDEELAKICTSVAGEDALAAAGCLGGALAALLVLAGVLGFGSLVGPALVGLTFTLVTLVLAHQVIRRPRRYREELAYRSGRGPLSQYVAEAEAILRRHGADWVLLFTLSGLPHGGFWWLRLVLKEAPPASARADLRVCPRWQLQSFERIESDVPNDILQDLLLLLKGPDLAALADVPSFVIDGARCHLTVLRREPWLVRSATCNLMDFGGSAGEPAQHTAVFVSSKLTDIIHRLTPQSGS